MISVHTELMHLLLAFDHHNYYRIYTVYMLSLKIWKKTAPPPPRPIQMGRFISESYCQQVITPLTDSVPRCFM